MLRAEVQRMHCTGNEQHPAMVLAPFRLPSSVVNHPQPPHVFAVGTQTSGSPVLRRDRGDML